MLERLDAALGGWLDRTLPAVDVVPPFAAFICWSGLLFDLAIPFALLFGGPRLRWGVALPAATTFNALNKAWFHLGVFPYLMLASLVLFFPPFPPSPPPSTSAAVRQQLTAADAAAAAAAATAAAATTTVALRGGFMERRPARPALSPARPEAHSPLTPARTDAEGRVGGRAASVPLPLPLPLLSLPLRLPLLLLLCLTARDERQCRDHVAQGQLELGRAHLSVGGTPRDT